MHGSLASPADTKEHSADIQWRGGRRRPSGPADLTDITCLASGTSELELLKEHYIRGAGRQP